MEKLIDSFPEVFLSVFSKVLKIKNKYSAKSTALSYIRGFDTDASVRHIATLRQFFLGNDFLFDKPDISFIKEMLKDLESVDTVRKIQILDFKSYLRDNLLVKTDRASMFNSLEVRVPYLDNKIIDYAFSYPKRHLDLFTTKKLLRNIAKKHLPEIADLPKSGFGIPIADWMKDELFGFTHDVLNNDKLYKYVDKKDVDSLLKRHKEGEKDNSGILWSLVMFSGWLNNWA